MNGIFEPVILAFCCKWCSYAAADLAGSMRISYPPNVKIIQVPCTGRVDVLHLLRAFESGADGVFLSGCLLGDCHYLSGNHKAQRRVAYTRRLLEELGIESERIEMYFNSSGMGPNFAQTCRDFTLRIRGLGPIYARHTFAAAEQPAGNAMKGATA